LRRGPKERLLHILEVKSWEYGAAIPLGIAGVAILWREIKRRREATTVESCDDGATLLMSGLLIFIGVTFLRIQLNNSTSDPIRNFLLVMVPNLLAVVGLAILRRRDPCFRRALAHQRSVAFRQILLGVVTFVAFVPGIRLIHEWALSRQSDPSIEQDTITLFRGALDSGQTSALFIMSLAIVVLVPLFEEWIFRGLFQSGLQGVLMGRLREPVASCASLLLTAFLFTGVHPPFTWMTVLFLALVMGTLRLATSNLWASTSFHVCHNLAALLFLLQQ
jgi:membrane protease YdiL (CAAX protease family)